MKTAIIFDLDGTLLDTLDDLWESVNFTLEKMGFPQRSREEVRSFVGNGVPKLIERSLPKETSTEDFSKALKLFREYYGEHCMDKTKPYDGIPDVLSSLRNRGFFVGVVSNKIDSAVKSLCHSFFDGLVDVCVGQTEIVPIKPDPASVYAVMRELECERAVYVGDSEVDILTAKNAKIPCISVCWGFKDKDFLPNNGAQTVVQSVCELTGEIEKFCD